MFSDLELILTVPPEGAKPTQANGLTPAHMAYRVGDGPHLFRAALPTASRGGYMVIDDVGFNGLGEATPLCHEILRECTARGFTGVICDFEAKPFQVLVRAVAQLGELLEKRGWPLLVPEAYAHASDKARVLVSSALSGGSLKQKLADAVERYGQSRVVLAVERTALDFYLPSPTGQGPLSPEGSWRRGWRTWPPRSFSPTSCAPTTSPICRSRTAPTSSSSTTRAASAKSSISPAAWASPPPYWPGPRWMISWKPCWRSDYCVLTSGQKA